MSRPRLVPPNDSDSAGGNAPPYWLLLSILFSSIQLSDSLARLLHDNAYEMLRRDEVKRLLRGPLLQGELENLRQDVLLGTFSGPVFEAKVETERGAGTVRFLLTRGGIEWMASRESRSTLN